MQTTRDQRTNRDRSFPHALPFPRARKSAALEAEDRFMELHGGRGARVIYRTVCLIETSLGTIIRFLRGVVSLLRARSAIANESRHSVKSGQHSTDSPDATSVLRLGSERPSPQADAASWP